MEFDNLAPENDACGPFLISACGFNSTGQTALWVNVKSFFLECDEKDPSVHRESDRVHYPTQQILLEMCDIK